MSREFADHNPFCFEIEDAEHCPGVDDESNVTRALRMMIESLLDVVTFTVKGQLMDVDGFIYNSERYNADATVVSLFVDLKRHLFTKPKDVPTTKATTRPAGSGATTPYDLDVLRRTEPRIELLVRIAKVLNALATFSCDEGRLATLKLRDLNDWCKPSTGDPLEVLSPLSRACNARCHFCYVLGNPVGQSIKLNHATTTMSGAESDIRLHFFKSGKQLPQPTYDLEELMLHPRFFEFARKIRNVSNQQLSVTTNGYLIDRTVASELKALAPVEVSLSLNAVTPGTRAVVMGDRRQRGLRAIRNLHDAGVPTTVSVVAWPSITHSEMEKTIREADEYNIRQINVILGGYTKFFPGPIPFDVPDFWTRTVEQLAPLRDRLEHPMVIQPRIFEDSVHRRDPTAITISGTYSGSPARRAGLKGGDEILMIDDVRPLTRRHATALLSLLREEASAVKVVVGRGEGDIVATLTGGTDLDGYLYGPPYNDRFGIVLQSGSPGIDAFRQIAGLTRKHAAKRVVLMTSMVVQPMAAAMLKEFALFFAGEQVEIELAIPRCGFYGRNIALGELMMVEDFVEEIDRICDRRDGAPDLILIPSAAFGVGGWYRDIIGQPFHWIQRSSPVPVEPIIADSFE